MDKQRQLIQTAFELFYQHGIHAVGINQILQQSGIAKKTLYNHFESKEALIAAVLAYRDQMFYDWLEARVSQAEPGEAGLIAVFTALDDWINNRESSLMTFHGCFFINACAEYGYPQQPVHQQSARHKQRIRELIAQQVTVLKLNKQRSEFLIDAICMLKEGAIVQAHVSEDHQAAQKAARMVKLLLQQSLSR